jgi:hypothetical protein
MLSTLAELEPQFRRSSQQQLLVEMLLVRFALFDRTLSIEDVLRGLGDGGSRGSGQPATSARTESRSRPTERETRRAATLADTRTPRAAPADPGFAADRGEAPSQPERPPVSAAPPETAAAAVSPQEGGPGWKLGYEQMASKSDRPRLTSEAVRAERLAALRANDPVLDAAIEALDLELLD